MDSTKNELCVAVVLDFVISHAWKYHLCKKIRITMQQNVKSDSQNHLSFCDYTCLVLVDTQPVLLHSCCKTSRA